MAVVTVAFEDLDSWLQAQPDNTVNTPYELNITGLSKTDLLVSTTTGTLGYVLKQNLTKYVDLSNTKIPSSVEELHFSFYECTTLVIAPEIPSSVTDMNGCFYGCTTLVTAPNIPAYCIFINSCFENCTSLTTWKQKDSFNVQSSYSNAFKNCTLLVNIYTNEQVSVKNTLNVFYNNSTDNFPTNPDNLNFYTYDYPNPSEVNFVHLDTFLQGLFNNTEQTPYKIKVTGLSAYDIQSSERNGTLGYILNQNGSKYVSLEDTELPNVLQLTGTFGYCDTLIRPPKLPEGITTLENTFARARNLTIAPHIPNSVTTMDWCFFECSSLTTVPNIPSSVTSMAYCFNGCTSLVTIPNIPNSVTDIIYCFAGCAFTTAPDIPNSVTYLEGCFASCTSLVIAPTIPSSVINMRGCFAGCTSLTTAPNIPASVIDLTACFEDCSSLEEITLFEADLESLVANDKASYAFARCTSLTKIGVPTDLVEESDWHVFRLKFGASTVEGKVYDKTGTASNIAQTQITKSTLKLPIKTDELWFPSGLTDNEIDAIIQKVIQYRYTYWNKDVLPPDQKNFVLWADNPSHVKSNLPSLNVVNAVTSGDMHPVTSNAVAGALANKKNVQDAVNDPTSDGQQYWDFIRSITQDTNGKIYPVKSHVPYGWTTQAGIVTTYDDPSYDEDRSHVINRFGFWKANRYIHGEVNTGKTWVDGRIIYRNVFWTTYFPYQTRFAIGAIYADIIISVSGQAWTSVNTTYCLERWVGFYNAYPNLDCYNYDLPDVTGVYVIVEYVKPQGM